MVFIIKSDGERLVGDGTGPLLEVAGQQTPLGPPKSQGLASSGHPAGNSRAACSSPAGGLSQTHTVSQDAGSLAIVGGIPEPRGPQVSPGPRLAWSPALRWLLPSHPPAPLPTCLSPGVTSLAGILISEWLLEPLEETVVHLGAIFKLLFFKLRVCIINTLLGV